MKGGCQLPDTETHLRPPTRVAHALNSRKTCVTTRESYPRERKRQKRDIRHVVILRAQFGTRYFCVVETSRCVYQHGCGREQREALNQKCIRELHPTGSRTRAEIGEGPGLPPQVRDQLRLAQALAPSVQAALRCYGGESNGKLKGGAVEKTNL